MAASILDGLAVRLCTTICSKTNAVAAAVQDVLDFTEDTLDVVCCAISQVPYAVLHALAHVLVVIHLPLKDVLLDPSMALGLLELARRLQRGPCCLLRLSSQALGLGLFPLAHVLQGFPHFALLAAALLLNVPGCLARLSLQPVQRGATLSVAEVCQVLVEDLVRILLIALHGLLCLTLDVLSNLCRVVALVELRDKVFELIHGICGLLQGILVPLLSLGQCSLGKLGFAGLGLLIGLRLLVIGIANMLFWRMWI
mmetsp:Transcript_57496/g.149777  ORF Transcript_57496/g.149777 Transcript_57496/m.149777 type:complete len:255 (+) Transcript_57496:395-1159(+)